MCRPGIAPGLELMLHPAIWKESNYGLDLKVYFTETVGLRIDYRRYAIQTDEDDPSLEIPVGGVAISSEPDIDRFMAGLALRW